MEAKLTTPTEITKSTVPMNYIDVIVNGKDGYASLTGAIVAMVKYSTIPASDKRDLLNALIYAHETYPIHASEDWLVEFKQLKSSLINTNNKEVAL